MIEFREEGTTESTARYIDEGFMQHALEQVGVDGRKEQRAFLAYEQGLQVGIVIVENFWGALHFKYVFISSSHRRRGIGRQLMQRALAFGKERLYSFAFVLRASKADSAALPFMVTIDSALAVLVLDILIIS